MKPSLVAVRRQHTHQIPSQAWKKIVSEHANLSYVGISSLKKLK